MGDKNTARYNTCGMMEFQLNRILFPALILVLSLFPGCAHSTPDTDNALIAVPPALGEYIEQHLPEWSIPGSAISVFSRDEVLYERGFGAREMGKPGLVTPQTAFGIASVTKTQIASTLMVLVENGNVDLDEPIQTYLPQFALQSKTTASSLTARDCLVHQSGIESFGDWIEEVPFLSGREAIMRSELLPQAFPLRSKRSYNNFCFVILSELIHQKSGYDWRQALRILLWERAEMNNSYSGPREFTRAGGVLPTADGWSDNFPIGQKALDGDINVAVPHAMWPSAFNQELYFESEELENRAIHFHESAIDASQGIYMSVQDLRRYGQLLLSEGKTSNGLHLLSPRLVEQMLSLQGIEDELDLYETLGRPVPQLQELGYGLGHEVYAFDGRLLVGHTGDELGSAALFLIDPVNEFGIAIAINNRLYSSYEIKWIAEPLLNSIYNSAPLPSDVNDYLSKERELRESSISGGWNDTPYTDAPYELRQDLIGKYRHAFAGGIAIYEIDGQLRLSRGYSYEYELLVSQSGDLIGVPLAPRRNAIRVRTAPGHLSLDLNSDVSIRFEKMSMQSPTHEELQASFWVQ